jgi:PIN domain nuclease of toxin-antitoxin system
MNGAPLLDTHAWIWWVDHDARLGRRFLDALDGLPGETRPAISDISLWEVATLVERGRVQFRVPFEEWLQAAAHPRTVLILPITVEVAAEIASLPESFHRDPADRVIVATSRALNMPLLTRDRLILDSRLASRWQP